MLVIFCINLDKFEIVRLKRDLYSFWDGGTHWGAIM